MKRVLCLLLILFSAFAAQGQDFASKFMEQCGDKEGIECQTISPKMMERLMSIPENMPEDKNGETTITYFVSKLKSARIITACKDGEVCFGQARQLLEKNKNRFTPLSENSAGRNNQIFVRRNKESIRELVLLNLNKENGILTIINFTGDMDDTFIRQLSKEKKSED